MKRFRYFFLVYLTILALGTGFFYADDDLNFEKFIAEEAVEIIENNLIESDQNTNFENIQELVGEDLFIDGNVSGTSILSEDKEIFTEKTDVDSEYNSGQKIDNTSDIIEILDIDPIGVQLKITEVYRDGTDEWIEITNIGNTIFSGDIIISGAKTTSITVSNIIINPNQSWILGDSCSIIVDFSYVWSTGLAMSISDTNPSNISIYYSGVQIDSLNLDSNILSQYNNTDTSIEKIKIDSDYYATGTSSDRVFNIISGYIANPGIIFDLTNSGSNNTGTISTGNQTGEIQNTGNYSLSQLSITEVFFDGYDEWLEITNFSTGDFSGDISIYGASSSPINFNSIFIQSGSSIIIADDGQCFLNSGGVILNTLSISDTNPISVFLYHSGIQLDLFQVSKSFVDSINNQKTSFERIINTSGLLVTTITNTDRIFNIISGYMANPGKVYQSTGEITDISIPTTQTELNLSGLTIPIDCINHNSSIFQITEIFPSNSQVSTFIELLFLDDFSGTVLFSGGLLTDNFYQNLQISSGERILISNGYQGFLEQEKIVVNTSLELQSSSGWLIAHGQSGQVLDIVYYFNPNNSQSSYFDGLYSSCARIFNYNDNYSPGFDRTLLSYFPQGLPIYLDKIVYVGGGGSCSCSNSIINTGQSSNSNTSTNIDPNLLSDQIKILFIEYDPEGSDTNNESITLQSFANQDIDLDNYRLQVVGKTSKKTVRGDILHSLSIESFTGNYQFPNSASCINLLYDYYILDTYCYSGTSDNSSQEEPLENTNYSSQSFGILEIVNIEYDPEGSDVGNEYIILKLNSGEQLNLGDYKLQIDKDSKITKKSLSGILLLGQEQTIRGNFSFPNSTNNGEDVVVSVLSPNQEILAIYNYNPNLPKIIPPPGIYNVYSVLDGDTFRIRYNEKLISFRLLGVDAPESSSTRFGYPECFGAQSKEYLKNLINKKDINIQYQSGQLADSYGRLLTYVFMDSQNINQNMIQNGYTREYTHQGNIYQYQSTFLSSQSYASSNQLGLRSPYTCSGQRLNALSGNIIQTGISISGNMSDIKILSILPNPQGNDKGNETITLFYNHPNLTINSGQEISGNNIDLGIGYYLLIGTRKKYLSGILYPSIAKTLTGDFAFPNSASCVKLYLLSNIIDTFCYDKPDNGEEFKINNGVLSSISNIDISILNQSKLQTIGTKLCLTYQGQTIHCKSIPSSKTSTKNQNKIRLYENYLDLIDDYMRQNRGILFYNTEIKNYFDLLNEAKKNISDGIYYVNIDGEFIQTTDISTWYTSKYNQTSYDYLVSVLKQDLLGNDLVEKYKKLKGEYFKYLENNY
ncbi:thermonuclease family protein [Candidatus Gracilibacteria bacterium]|nr:thermonuclease family protein [Candidatus Gracilibacteria bacterium]